MKRMKRLYSTRTSTEEIRREKRGYINREKFDALTDEDIAHQIAADPDLAPETTDEDLKRARIVKPYQIPEQA